VFGYLEGSKVRETRSVAIDLLAYRLVDGDLDTGNSGLWDPRELGRDLGPTDNFDVDHADNAPRIVGGGGSCGHHRSAERDVPGMQSVKAKSLNSGWGHHGLSWHQPLQYFPHRTRSDERASLIRRSMFTGGSGARAHPELAPSRSH
jgi:hypothetical protein